MTKPKPPGTPRDKPGPKPGRKAPTERIGGLRVPLDLRARLRRRVERERIKESEGIRRAVAAWTCDGSDHEGEPCWCGQGGPP